MVVLYEKLEFVTEEDCRNAIGKFYTYLCSDVLKIKVHNPDDKNQQFGYYATENFFSSLPHQTIKVIGRPFYIDYSQFRSSPDEKENNVEVLEQFLTSQRIFDRNELISKLKFAVIGGSEEMQIFCQNIGELFESKPDLITTVEYMVYIIPFHKSALANFIGKHDIWYRRNVQAAFKEPRVFPLNDFFTKSQKNTNSKN